MKRRCGGLLGGSVGGRPGNKGGCHTLPESAQAHYHFARGAYRIVT